MSAEVAKASDHLGDNDSADRNVHIQQKVSEAHTCNSNSLRRLAFSIEEWWAKSVV